MAVMRHCIVALVVFFLCVSVGCDSGGPNVAPVEGIVTMDGVPIADKEVVFSPETGRASMGTTDEDGWYELDYSTQRKGALIGRHTVTVTTTNPNPYGPPPPDWVETVPDKYHTQTELTAEVKKGRNKINFDLTSN